jgi:hypothetical protein
MVKYFKRVFWRDAAAIITSATKGGTYPDYTVSGWTPVPGNVVAAALIPDKEVEEEADGGSSMMVVAEKVSVEVTISDFSTAEYATLRALKNEKLDILLMDPDQPEESYAAFGVRVYPKPDFSSKASPKIVLTGQRNYSSSLTTEPLQLVTIS